MNKETQILNALEQLQSGLNQLQQSHAQLQQSHDELAKNQQQLQQGQQRLEANYGRLEKGQQGILARLDKMESDIAEIKEDAAITRSATNSLVEWADTVGVITQVPFPIKKVSSV